MIPRPFHRWKSFWFGLLVVAFLGWAWVRSMAMLESAVWKPKDWGILFGQYDGKLEFRVSSMRDIDPGFDYFRLARPAWSRADWLQPAVKWSVKGGVVTSLAHWFLILLFLFPWTAFLFWRGRRMKRLAADP